MSGTQVNDNIQEFDDDLARFIAELPGEVLKPLARFSQTVFAAYATGDYMQDAGFSTESTRVPRSPGDNGPLRIVSTRLASAVAGNFYGGRREFVDRLEVSKDGFVWSREIYVPYAALHEYGGTVRVPVTERMRGFFWARFYEAGGAGSPEAEKWKAMALTRQTVFTIEIEARPYAGPALRDAAPDIEEEGGWLLTQLAVRIIAEGL